MFSGKINIFFVLAIIAIVILGMVIDPANAVSQSSTGLFRQRKLRTYLNLQCLRSGANCQADGRWGNCCSGYCHQWAGYSHGLCT